MNNKDIRNFSIIAHIDHGKSTLADRILEKTNAVTKRELKEQILDSMELERERGITIKLNAVSLEYKGYYLNLIDTPGHVDFTYEVSRSLAACEGAVLVVDATQGIEAQTLANVYLALDNDLEIIPVVNKIDLPNAEPELRKQELIDTFGFDGDEIIFTSGKTGEGVEELLEKIIKKVPSPKGNKEEPLQALVFDSFYDSYKGVIIFLRVVNGILKKGSKVKMMKTNAIYEVIEVGKKTPKEVKKEYLKAGEVGYITASIKSVDSVNVGDTITEVANPCKEPLPGYKPLKPMVYSGLYPIDSSQYKELREALEKLKLNDASLSFEPENSEALGFGFRCGFLGLLHMEIITERIEREFEIDLIVTSPSVIYEVYLTNGEKIMIDGPTKLPEVQKINEIKEPYIKANVFVPEEYIGAIMELCQNKRGNYIKMTYIDAKRVNIIYELPLSEIVYDFFDKLKSATKGYASFDYDIIGYRTSNLVKLEVLVNSNKVDALAVIVHKSFAYERGKIFVEKLKEIIPRQMIEIPIQASIGNKVIARSTIKALRKNVLAKCYGGDISRKRKLLEKQKEGKKKMKAIGNVEIPGDAFISILKTNK